jgi:hypothetical protein
LHLFPAPVKEKKTFSYYLNGLSTQEEGKYSSIINLYSKILKIEEYLCNQSIILYNIGLIYSTPGDYLKP